MHNDAEFLAAMRREIDPGIFDFAEALYRAMDRVTRHADDAGIRYFGCIGDGIFFSGNSIDACRWYEDTTISDAIEMIAEDEDLGEGMAAGLDPLEAYLEDGDAGAEA